MRKGGEVAGTGATATTDDSLEPAPTAAVAGDRAAGTAHALVCQRLAAFPPFRAFRAGRLPRVDLQRAIDGLRPEECGLNEDKLNLATRFSTDEAAIVGRALATLRADGVLTTKDYPEDQFVDHRAAVEERFDHGPNLTFIFPEEARLLFALASIVRPRRTVFLGSYYGYWAIWAMPAIAAARGRAVLVDPDSRVLELSERNMADFGHAALCEFVCLDAREYLTGDSSLYDLAVLDAEGPHDAGPRELRAKAIYGPLTEAVTPRLRRGGLLVAHNMLLENLTDNAYFAKRIADNRRQFERFFAHIAREYDLNREFPTTEGVGVYRRAVQSPTAVPASA